MATGSRRPLPLAAFALTARYATALLLLPAPTPSTAAESSPATNPPVRRLTATSFAVGPVQFDREARTVRFPARVNMRSGNLEYLLVTSSGKTHESLLRTEARPYELQVAFLLLGLSGTTNALPEDPKRSLPGQPLDVWVCWQTNGQPRQQRIEDFVTDHRTGRAASAGPWIYTGSRWREDGFAAEIDGSLISLITDPDALINNPRPGREDDDNWLARPGDLPPLLAEVEVLIRLERR